MKLFTLFFACSLGLAHASESYAQTAIVNVEVQNKTVGEILKKIEKQSDFDFFFDNTLIDLNRRVSVTSRNSDIFKVLEKVFKGTNVKYSVLDKKIVLTINADNVQTAQQTTFKVTGKVVDENGEEIIGASVLEKGTINGTVTDMDGNFELKVSGKEVILEVSYIGYSKAIVKTKAGTITKVVLKEDTEVLDEVVVVAYGTQKKSNLTGSVDVVSSKEMENRPVTSASSMLQGKASSITFSTPAGGNAPGSAPTLQIRGQAALSETTPPLVVIDGIPSDMGAFNALNPNEIESISILKDAAASAVYGARAPYGVLLVTTKMGGRNEKAVVTYSGNYGIVNPINMPKTLDSYTFGVIRNQSYINARSQAPFTDEDLDIIRDNILNPELTRAEPHLSLHFKHNIILHDKGETLVRTWDKANVDMDYNLYWRTDSTPITMMDKSFAEWKKMKEPHSVMLDPLFKDVKNDDYTLVSRKNIRKIGFKPFNYSEAGVYGDKEWRKKALLSLQKLELFKKMASIRLQK